MRSCSQHGKWAEHVSTHPPSRLPGGWSSGCLLVQLLWQLRLLRHIARCLRNKQWCFVVTASRRWPGVLFPSCLSHTEVFETLRSQKAFKLPNFAFTWPTRNLSGEFQKKKKIWKSFVYSADYVIRDIVQVHVSLRPPDGAFYYWLYWAGIKKKSVYFKPDSCCFEMVKRQWSWYHSLACHNRFLNREPHTREL